MTSIASAIVLTLALLSREAYVVNEEVSLFNSAGEAEAYIDVEGGLTVYLWDGKPAAYLDEDQSGGFHVHGFNGKHLGWFIRGAVWDHDGKVACATKELLPNVKLERFKSFKQFRPFKAFKELVPLRPMLTPAFGEATCRLLLVNGAAK